MAWTSILSLTHTLSITQTHTHALYNTNTHTHTLYHTLMQTRWNELRPSLSTTVTLLVVLSGCYLLKAYQRYLAWDGGTDKDSAWLLKLGRTKFCCEDGGARPAAWLSVAWPTNAVSLWAVWRGAVWLYSRWSPAWGAADQVLALTNFWVCSCCCCCGGSCCGWRCCWMDGAAVKAFSNTNNVS
jgi:hypothetical protein